MLPLAQTEPMPTWALIIGLSQLAGLGLTCVQLFRAGSGRDRERQIEPTQLAALSTKLDSQTTALSTKLDGQTTALGTMNREMGAMSEAVESLTAAVGELRQLQREDIAAAHRRIDQLSNDVSRHSAEIEAIQRTCGACSKS